MTFHRDGEKVARNVFTGGIGEYLIKYTKRPAQRAPVSDTGQLITLKWHILRFLPVDVPAQSPRKL